MHCRASGAQGEAQPADMMPFRRLPADAP